MSEVSRPIVVEIPSDSRLAGVVRQALAAVVSHCPDVRLEPREVEEISLVLQEAVTNVVRHAHFHDAARPLRVEFRRHVDMLEILVRDEGAPFHLDTAELEPEMLREGGYGIHIMRSWMHDVSVARHGGDGTAGGNILRLVRRYGEPLPRRTEAARGARG